MLQRWVLRMLEQQSASPVQTKMTSPNFFSPPRKGIAAFPALIALLLLVATASEAADGLPAADMRASRAQDANSNRTFPEISSKSEWTARAKEIREQIL